MWPKIPKDITTLSIDELAALSNELRDFATKMLGDPDVSADDKAKVKALLATRDEIKARHAQLVQEKADADAQAAEDARVLAELEAETELGGDEPDDAGGDDGEGGGGDGGDAADDDDDDDEPDNGDASAKGDKELAVVGAPKVKTTFGTKTKPAKGGGAARTASSYLQVMRGVEGKVAGETFDSWAELAAAAVAKAQGIAPDDSGRYALAKIKGNYPKDRQLGDDMMLNMAKFEGMDEVMAAWCPPATPYYDVACMNTVRRPVFGSLPGFAAPRGRVTTMPSPDLADITSGYGQWTTDDDADANARKTCITVTCGSPTTYEMYAVWRCMTVKNMLAMTYPELVEAWLNRLHAAQARLGETLLLDAMGTAATANVDAPALGYGASVTLTSTILNYLALYQETQRWDITGNMKAWAPRWVLWGMKMDIMRRRRTDGNVVVPSDAEIETMFRNVGIDVTWFIDTPTWAVAIPAVHTANVLNLLPQSVQILIAPPGKFALIDRGDLNIGVTGDNKYRDNDSNAQNQFTFFFESFEGVVSTTTCPAHILDIPVCWNGVQIDDIVINCQGRDEVGYQS